MITKQKRCGQGELNRWGTVSARRHEFPTGISVNKAVAWATAAEAHCLCCDHRGSQGTGHNTPSLPRMEASCLELALEGERLCKAGDFKAGVAFFEAAVQVGTEDLKTLSAIYSQLGNAYFYLKEYARALQFHKHDLLLAR